VTRTRFTLTTLGRTVAAALALGLAGIASFASPAVARDAFVQDGAGLFSAATVSSLNQTISAFNQQTGKEIVVVTVPSLDGQSASAAAEKVFAQQQVNGVLIFLAKAEKQDGIIGDRASQAFFPPGTFANVRQAMRGYFRTGDFDTGITTGVNLVLDQYRSHERALGASRQPVAASHSSSSFGGGMSLFWLILILIAGFLVIRAIFRAMAGPRMMPPGYGGPGPGPGYPGYGAPGYGGGYGMGGGGGSFFSGLLGGLGGAFIGNELFGRHDGGFVGGDQAGFVGGDAGSGYQGDASGWQSDAGQADMGNASFGDFGSSGGGFDGGGGGFDGGGGDSGGGW
jgi:uncharacterized protein